MYRYWNKYHELFLVILVGISFMLIFIAFNAACQSNESILEGARKESKGHFTASGYTSLALVYFSCAVFNWLSPAVVSRVKPQYGMFLGSLTYLLFLTSFFKPKTWFIYMSSILLGMGAAVLWTSNGVFITSYSKPHSLNRNFGIFWMIFNISGLIGSTYAYYHLSDVTFITAAVRIPMYTALTVICAVGSGLLLTLPNSSEHNELLTTINNNDDVVESENIAVRQSEPASLQSVLVIAKKSFGLFRTKPMFATLIASAFTGLNLTFFSGVYGTCLSRMAVFGEASKSYIGLSGVFISIGAILGSQATFVCRKANPVVIIFCAYSLAILAYLLAFLMIPALAPITDTQTIAYIQPSVHLAAFIALLLGVVDALWNTQISVLLSRSYPLSSNLTASAFSLYKFVQAVSSAIAFFYSSALNLTWQLVIMSIQASIGFIGFAYANRQIRIPELVDDLI